MDNSQEKIAFLMQRMGDAAFEAMSFLDKKGRILHENEATQKLLGYPPAERLGNNYASYLMAKSQHEFLDLIQNEDNLTSFSGNCRHKDGHGLKLFLKGSYLDFPGMEKVILICAKPYDLAELNDVRILNDILEKAEEIGLQGSYEWDINTGELTLSKGWQRIHGTLDMPITLNELMTIVHPDDADRVKNALDDAILNHEDYRIEHRIVRFHDKQERIVKSAAKVNYDRKGKPTKMIGFVQDVTEQKGYEEKINASEAFHREILHAINDTVFLTNCEGEIIYICPNLTFIFGVEEEQITNVHTVDDLMGDGFATKTNVLENHFIENTEHKLVNYKGIEKHVLVTAKALKNKPDTLLFTVHDVTDLTNIKQKLEHSLRDLQLAQEISSTGNWQLRPDSAVPVWSDEVYKIYDRDPAEGPFQVSDYSSVFAPDQLTIFKNALQKALSDGVAYDIILHFKSLRGQKRWIRSICRPEKVSYSAKFFLRGTIQNITSEMLAAEALKESEKRYRLLADHSKDIIALFNDAKLLYISPSVKKILGYSAEELSQMDLSTLFHPDEHTKMVEILMRPLKQKVLHPTKYAYRQRHKSGHYIWLETLSTYQRLKDGTLLVVANSRDISDRVKTEQNLKEHEQELMGLNATKDKLFSIISHDLRSPFNAILGFSDLAITALKKKDYESLEKYSRYVNATAQNTYNLLENLLSWSRIQSKKIEFDPKTLELSNPVNECIRILQGNAEEKHIRIITEMEEDLEILADRFMLETIIRNLLSNAIKFTPKNGLIRIKAFAEKQLFFFSIQDTGVGMEKAVLDKLFEPGSETSTRGTESEKGAGLGLLLCREFVETHGGEIWAKSELNKGTTFTFTLPVVP